MSQTKPPSDIISFFTPNFGVPVYQNSFISKVSEDGKKILAFVIDGKDPKKAHVLVHPDHWDEFIAAVEAGHGDIAISYGKTAGASGDDEAK